MKIKLQFKDLNNFELDLFESFCSVPIIIDNKMIIGTHTTNLDLLDSTYNQLPETLKEMLNRYETRNFYLKSSLLTITGLTAYNIDIGFDKKTDVLHAGKIFDNFDKERGHTLITCACYLPSGSMAIHF